MGQSLQDGNQPRIGNRRGQQHDAGRLEDSAHRAERKAAETHQNDHETRQRRTQMYSSEVNGDRPGNDRHVGAFANGADIWQRLLVVPLHPLGAAGVLVLVLRPRLATTTILALAALLTVNVVADLGLAQLMAAGRVRGDWELALAFSVVPVIGVVYALARLRTARRTAG